MKNTELISLLEKLSKQFHTILLNMEQANQRPDGIIKSMSISLDNALHNFTNNLPITDDIKSGIDNSCNAAVRIFEGSGVDDDFEKLESLLCIYETDK